MRTIRVAVFIAGLASLLLAENSFCRSGIRRTGDVGPWAHSVSFGLITPNIMDMAVGVYTDFALPDTFTVSIRILDTLLNPVYEFDVDTLGPGTYNLTWIYEDRKAGTEQALAYVLQFTARTTGFFRAEWAVSQRFLTIIDDRTESK